VKALLVVFLLALALVPAAAAAEAERGRLLFQESCASCHGLDARGIDGQGPDLRGAGAAAADFYLSTGRMPLDDPGTQPDRHRPAFSRSEIDDLVAYVASLGPGPGIPRIPLDQGDLSEGQKLFTENCAGCHQIAGRGGVVTGGFAPILLDSTARQIAEAVRIGPYLMPVFGPEQLSDREVASIIRYVEYAKNPENPGGWGLFEIGPVPEGMVAWLIGLLALVIVIRITGERNEW
jgi:ubiquinol-cytochrome c reductase cytochrome c subunit